MNKKFMEDVLNIVINYESLSSEFEEVIKILEKFEYEINDENSQKINNILVALKEQGYDINNILRKYTTDDFIYLDDIIKLFTEDIYTDKCDNFILEHQEKFSDVQRNNIFENLIEQINEEQYPFGRLPVLFKILIRCEKNNGIIIEVLKNILDKNLISNEKIANEFDTLIKSVYTIIDDSLLNYYIEKLLENCISSYPSQTLEKIERYKKQISLPNIQKMASYVETSIDINNYKYVFNIYSENCDKMLGSDDTALQLQNFLVNHINLSSNIENTIILLKNKFSEIKSVLNFVNRYLKIDFNNKVMVERKYRELIYTYYNKRDDEAKKTIIIKLLSVEILSKDAIEKINNLFSMNEFSNFRLLLKEIVENKFGSMGELSQQNLLNIFIITKNIELIMLFMTQLFDDLSNEEYIKRILNILNGSEIKITGKSNSELWGLFNSAKNGTSSESLFKEIGLSINKLKLKESLKKDKQKV